MFTKNVFTQKDPIADLVKPMLEAQTKTKMEELKGNQAVLDKNKNNKLDADDFKILRGEKKAVKEENVEESSPFDWKKPREPEVNGGAGVKKGRAYGGAAQKSKPEQDDADEKKKTQKEEVESKEKEEKDDIPFDGPYKKKDSAKAGKHGAGYSTARHLAQMGMKKALKKEDVEDLDEASYSAKAARAGEDIGKPGKMFNKIAKGAAARYGSMERGKKVAGAVLAKLRKEEIEQIEELSRSTVKSYIDKKTDKIHSSAGTTSSLPGAKDLDSLQRAHARLVGNKPTTAKKTGDIQVDVRNKKVTKNEEVEHIDERTLTKGETAEKERIVKGMKKSLSGFKARYGDRAKSVMYATATKAAKKD
jgi:hypothetical protein